MHVFIKRQLLAYNSVHTPLDTAGLSILAEQQILDHFLQREVSVKSA